ncbi:GerAB/ArcD/ProY family transporter [Neobacillus bataviensis]|uniref:GerAB/ArcD/ProY family transporter n=1 Tax=Neobacillus bataviensis TaxID=220685 RepID=UPI001CBEA54B|nr:GerAB/ArcD/ProY family transporter [Neobacillus bataviensis]
MKQKISNLQLIFLTANFIFSSTVISLPQIIVHIGGQNSWLVPFLIFPITLIIIFVVFGKKGGAESFKHLFVIGEESKIVEKGFIFLFLLFVISVFLRDLRSIVDFIAAVLLPNTPIDILMVLSVLVISYITMSGLEVVSRINAIYFGILLTVVCLLPFLLLNEWEPGNLMPLPRLNTIITLMKSVYFSFSWMGEIILFLIIIGNVNPISSSKSAVITGTAIGLFLFFIIILLQIAVLGTKIVKEAMYPSLILIQQINITDFLDRLDLIIVAVWVPAFIVKISYVLYALNHCLSFLYKSNTNKFLFPVSFILGFLSILIYKNNMDHLHYSFYTWSSLGLFLEMMIVVLFIFVKKVTRKKQEKKTLNN